MNIPVTAPFWCSLPDTNSAKLDGASYDTVEQALEAASKRTESKVIVFGSRQVFGAIAPVCIRVVERP